jgi:nonsense-mediated mRNA decay protein 3
MATFTATMPTILCCMCGIEIHQNPANMCVTCLRSSVDITSDIPRQLTIHSCRSCGRLVGRATRLLCVRSNATHSLSNYTFRHFECRFLCPPWQKIELESKELMAACLRKIPSLNKVKLIGKHALQLPYGVLCLTLLLLLSILDFVRCRMDMD